MSGGKTQTTTSSNTIDPKLMALYQQNYASAQGVANLPFQPFTGEAVAGLTPSQRNAGLLYGDIANNRTGSAAVNAGVGGATNALGFNAPNVNTSPVLAGLLRNADLSPYMNPYTANVINSTMTANDRARAMALNSNAQAAQAQKAFGGARSGILDAETQRGYDQNSLDAIARLNAVNFEQAQGGATADINRTLQQDMFNSGQAFDASGANASNALASNAARLQASGLLGSLGGQQLDMAAKQAQGLNAYGTEEQLTRQAEDDAAYQEFLRRIGYPAAQQDIRNASLGLIPVQQSQTSTTRQSGGGLSGILGAIGSVANIFSGG